MDLSNRVSSEDMQRVNDMHNHPTYEPGFEGGGDDMFGDFGDSGDSMGAQQDDLNSLFGDSSDGFGDSSGGFGSGGFGDSSGGFGSGTGGFGSESADGFGNSNGFGGSTGGFGSNTNGFGPSSPFGQQQQKPDTMDKLFDAGADAAKNLGEILVELFKSIKLRNADDIGYLSRNAVIGGAVMCGASLALLLIGKIASFSILSASGLMGQTLLCGGLMLGSGTLGLGTAALVLAKTGDRERGGIDNIPDIPAGDDNYTEEFETNIGDELDDMFDMDLDAMLDAEDEKESDSGFGDDTWNDDDETFMPGSDVATEEYDPSVYLDNVQENSVINRQSLFNLFKPMFPKETPNFRDGHEIDKDSEDFNTLETICLKALANLANCQLEEVGSYLESAKDNFSSYELLLKRVNKVKKTDELAREIETYMRESPDDDAVTASVALTGDFYKIVVSKGMNAIITFGDIFQDQKCCDFFLNEKNKLPMVTGVDELGNVILEDAKNFDTMLIAGKPRSGKSWYVLSIIISLMLFNSPEDVQFCIIDPKESNLFKTIALLPHVCGLHNDEHILEILNDIIEVEAPRRKKLLSDNRCDDIWALRQKGIKLPILYVVIDEYITVVNNLDADEKKDFNLKMQTLISQLPSQGIRLLFVPHRATGIVDKTNRTMLQFTAAVRADAADVVDTLGIKKWDRALTRPGDIALKSSTMKNAAFVRGAALTTNDGANSMFIEQAAKAFYKMGVEMPDMSNMRIAVNRDEDYVRSQLQGTGKTLQYNADELGNLDNLDSVTYENMVENTNREYENSRSVNLSKKSVDLGKTQDNQGFNPEDTFDDDDDFFSIDELDNM